MYIRDFEGNFVLTKSMCSVDVGEALGFNHALQWVVDLRLDGMNFSLDSKVVVDAFNGASNDDTNFGSIIIHCRQLFINYFHNSKVEFSRRQINRVVHQLVKAVMLEASTS